MNSLMAELNAVKEDLTKWKEGLPSYYEPITVPVICSEDAGGPVLGKYPYPTRLDYVTSN
jgi:hypothetical protein